MASPSTQLLSAQARNLGIILHSSGTSHPVHQQDLQKHSPKLTTSYHLHYYSIQATIISHLDSGNSLLTSLSFSLTPFHSILHTAVIFLLASNPPGASCCTQINISQLYMAYQASLHLPSDLGPPLRKMDFTYQVLHLAPKRLFLKCKSDHVIPKTKKKTPKASYCPKILVLFSKDIFFPDHVFLFSIVLHCLYTCFLLSHEFLFVYTLSPNISIFSSLKYTAHLCPTQLIIPLLSSHPQYSVTSVIALHTLVLSSLVSSSMVGTMRHSSLYGWHQAQCLAHRGCHEWIDRCVGVVTKVSP